eukprot:gb/GECH01009248.1/.p1 GENE.gb/GECH01009248.1/~~gb/GECH01009248.1/.p1  ORF type:complete len:161 (+),score=22.02 gb/GECH01009248.1/:1-483(+)
MEETDYKFNGEGKLVDKHSGKPFVFQTQEHYKKVGNAVVSYIQNIMRGPEFQMKEMVLPLDQNQDSNSNEKINTPKTHIFYTSDAFTTLDKPVLIILQGKGPVRAGQWSRSLCVNDRCVSIPFLIIMFFLEFFLIMNNIRFTLGLIKQCRNMISTIKLLV